MPHITSFAAVAAFAAQAFAAPAPQASDSASNGFSVEQVAVAGSQYYKSGPAQILKTYAKYNATVSTKVVSDLKVAAAQQSGTVAANPESYDESYLCPVKVGSQTLMLDFDTGSSDLWVFSTLQASSQRTGHTAYNPSTGAVETGETWKISYGDGSGASGTVYSDKVVVGPVTATSQAVEAATSVSSSFTSDTDNDGLLGLAYPNINTCSPNQCSTFFETVQSSLPNKLFTATLKHGAAGSYDFGFINTTKYTGALTYTPVTQQQYWMFQATTYTVGGTSFSGNIGSSIADTGTTLWYLPSAVVSNYYSKVSGAKNSASAGGWVFPCSATLPNFVVTIGGATHTVPGSLINYSPYAGSTCFGGIQPNTGIGFSIFGDIFLKSQFVVFDVGNNRLGFAQQA